MHDYLTYTTEKLYGRLAEIVTELVTIYSEIADMDADELRERARAYLESQASTVTGRQQDATINSVLPATEAILLRARRDALNEEKQFVLRLLDDRNS